MIHDNHTAVNLPSTIADHELIAIASDSTALLPLHNPEDFPTPSVHLYTASAFARFLTKLLDSFAVTTAAKTDPELMDRYETSMAAFEEALPSYFRPYPYTDHAFDEERFLAPHRLHLQAWLGAVRMQICRFKLIACLDPDSPPVNRRRLVQTCQQVLRTNRSARMLDPKRAFRVFSVERVFEAAVCLGLVHFVERQIHAAAQAGESNGSLSSRSQHLSTASALSEDQLAGTRLAMAEGIELLEGVSPWPDSKFGAKRSLKILRALQAKLTPVGGRTNSTTTPLPLPMDLLPSSRKTSPVRSPLTPAASSATSDSQSGHGRESEPIARVKVWLEGWRGYCVDTLMAEAEWEKWEGIVAGM